jgi:hypothetical protein
MRKSHASGRFNLPRDLNTAWPHFLKPSQIPKVIGDIAFNSRNKGTTQKEYTSIDLEKSITEHGELLSSNVYPFNDT